MRTHPIPSVTEPLQYRAIGIVRGIYQPEKQDVFSKGHLLVDNEQKIEAVVLGKMISLMKRHLSINDSHLWVVYPRCRDADHLHLQISGIWEPSTLSQSMQSNNAAESNSDAISEGDDFFSIRGELVYTKPEENHLIIKVRQALRSGGKKALPFKLSLKGNIPLEHLRKFVSLDARRKGQNLHAENYQIIGPIKSRGATNKRK